VTDEQFQRVVDTQQTVLGRLADQDKWQVRVDDRLDYLVEHAKKVNGTIDANQKAIIAIQQEMARGLTYIDRIPTIEKRIEHNEQMLQSGETAAGKIASQAVTKSDRVAEVAADLQQWRSKVTGAVSVFILLLTSSVVLLSVFLNQLMVMMKEVLQRMPTVVK